MADSGVIISCGTDLPLLYDNIPESIYHTVGALFPEGGAPFNEENTLTTAELLKAWTYGGQYNLGCESQLGTLKAGNLADIAVLDGNVFETPMDQIRGIKVCLTLVDGKIVHRTI
uniref:amidohydrolase family protein n=1 Tax=Clostridium sp. NkU-1 TaxID=1095009 RepID=UPI003260BEDC